MASPSRTLSWPPRPPRPLRTHAVPRAQRQLSLTFLLLLPILPLATNSVAAAATPKCKDAGVEDSLACAKACRARADLSKSTFLSRPPNGDSTCECTVADSVEYTICDDLKHPPSLYVADDVAISGGGIAIIVCGVFIIVCGGACLILIYWKKNGWPSWFPTRATSDLAYIRPGEGGRSV